MALLDSFKFWKTEPEDKQDKVASVETVEPSNVDGSMRIRGQHTSLNFEFSVDFKSYTRQIEAYRQLAELSDVDDAITEICNEAINFEDDELQPLELGLEDTEFSDGIKEKILEEFQGILAMMDFNTSGFEQFRSYYVDASAYYHKIVNPKQTKQGIIGIRKLDSAKTRRVVQYEKDNDGKIMSENVFFIYDPLAGKRKKDFNDFDPRDSSVIKFPKESISYVDSGMYSSDENFPKSHLHKAIRPANNLIHTEVSAVIYRMARSSEKRVFYIDIGRYNKTSGDSYIRQLMKSYRSSIKYDGNGEITSAQAPASILEDIWLPTRDGDSTKVDTLQSGGNLGEMDDVEYHLKKLYRSLNVPISRINADSIINFGNLGELDREELKFNKFIKRVRKRYNSLFLDLLQTQLLLKRIIDDKEWRLNKDKIKLIYNQDLYISEQKEAILMQDRIELAERAQPFVGKYMSHDTIRRSILKQSDDEIVEEDKKMQEELKDDRYKPEEESNF